MLNYNQTTQRPLQTILPNYQQSAVNLANAFNSIARGLTQRDLEIERQKKLSEAKRKEEERKALQERKKMIDVFSSDVMHSYKIGLENVLNDPNLKGNDKLKAIKELGDKHLEQLKKAYNEKTTTSARKTYQAIQLANIQAFNRVREVEEKKIKEAQKQDLINKIQSTSLYYKDALRLNKELGLGLDERSITKEYNRAGTAKAEEFIQKSVIDGVPSELTRFKSVDDIYNAFYKWTGLPKDKLDIPNSIINAIANANKWTIAQREKAIRDAQRARQAQANRALRRIEEEARRADMNGLQVNPQVENSLRVLDPFLDDKGRERARRIQNQIQDNKTIINQIERGFLNGKSKQQIENDLSQYTTISTKDKQALIGKVFNRLIGGLESNLDKAIKKGDMRLAGEYMTKLYQLDMNEGRKVANTQIKRELSLLNASSLDSAINSLQLYINAEKNYNNPIPLEEQRLLRDLESARLLIAGKESKQDISDYLTTKKREYLERKRTKHLRELTLKEQKIKEGLTSEWLEFDNYTTDKEIRAFLLANPDIPIDRVYDAFKAQTVDIDTTNIPLVKNWGKFDLAPSLQNGKLLIPDDRELGDNSISPFLKQYIPQHSDDFTQFVIDKTKENLKALEVAYGGKFSQIDNFYFIFQKTPHGLQLQAYGTPKGAYKEELLGVINHKELQDYLNKFK